MSRLIDVYPYRFNDDKVEFLLLHRAPDVQYAGQWRMVAGKIEDREKAWQAGLRELHEETGLQPKVYWAIPSINHFYNHHKDQVELIPAFAAEIKGGNAISLNKEHQDFCWVQTNEVRNLIYWPEQLRLITLIESILRNKKLLDDWVIPF